MEAKTLVALGMSLALSCASAGTAAPAPERLQIYGIEGRPISYVGEAGPDGMAVELARAVQQRIGNRDAILIIPWARAMTLANGGDNVLLLSVIRNPERDMYLQFVGPIFEAHGAAYAKRSRAAELRQRAPDLRSLRAGARRGTVFGGQAQTGGYHLMDQTNSEQSAARMLMLGRFDLWFTSQELAGNALQSAGYQMDDVELMLQLPLQPVYFAFSKNTSPAVVQAWENGLMELKRDGTFQRIHRKWFPTYALPAAQTVRH